jgi:phosphoglycerate dehydrogenase-like enzyme
MLQIAFVGAFAARLQGPVQDRAGVPCQVIAVDEAAIMSKLADLNVLVTLVFNREMAAAGRRLKLVQVPAAGLDRIDPSALPPGAWLANAYGHEVGIAEYVIGAILAWNRGLCRADALLRRGEWDSQWAAGPLPAPRPELGGKTLGVLGYGRIGQALARRARAFDMAIWAIRRDPTQPVSWAPDFLGAPDALDELLRRADYLVVTSPLTPATRGVLGQRELALMKPTAVLVNVARAEIVDEEALYQALHRGAIAGAILDVWYRYPPDAGPTLPSRLPFHELGNVLMTPHVSGWTEGMLEARAEVIAENIRRAARGEPPLNLVATGGSQ